MGQATHSLGCEHDECALLEALLPVVSGGMGAGRVAALDGVRALAVIPVVMFHLGLADSGYLGVDVFFVLSGYLITTRLLAEHERTGAIVLGTFYLRRGLRLAPAMFVVFVFCLLAAAIGGALRETLFDVMIAGAYLANLVAIDGGLLDHTWTLALEEQFYLVWPVLLLFALRAPARSGRARWLPAGAIIVSILLADLVLHQEGSLHSYVRAMGLPLGCALALRGKRGVPSWLGVLGWPCVIAYLVCVVLPLPAALTTGWPLSAGAVLAVPMVTLAISAAPPLLGMSVLVWVGERSYGIYLWHFPLVSLAENHAPAGFPHGLALVLAVLATIVAAASSYTFVEKPVLAWRDRRSEASASRTA